MAKKSSPRLQKLKTLLEHYIFLAKLKKPMLIEKTKMMKKWKPLKKRDDRYLYGYVKEYEFSPPRTPLVRIRRKRFGRTSFEKMYCDFLLFLKRLGGGVESRRGNDRMGVVDLTAAIDLWADESVDERAERFIQRFYEDMRRQRQEMHF